MPCAHLEDWWDRMLARLVSLGPSRGCRLLGCGCRVVWGWGVLGGWAWGLWAFPWGGFPLFFALLLLLFVSFGPLFRPSWLSRSFCFFLPFPSPFSCRFFSWLCSVLWLFALPRLSPCRLAFPSALRFAFFFCFKMACLKTRVCESKCAITFATSSIFPGVLNVT